MTPNRTTASGDDYGFTTAEIFYSAPHQTDALKSYIWQGYDTAPNYPKLTKFVQFWQGKLQRPLETVCVTHRKKTSTGQWRNHVC